MNKAHKGETKNKTKIFNMKRKKEKKYSKRRNIEKVLNQGRFGKEW